MNRNQAKEWSFGGFWRKTGPLSLRRSAEAARRPMPLVLIRRGVPWLAHYRASRFVVSSPVLPHLGVVGYVDGPKEAAQSVAGRSVSFAGFHRLYRDDCR